MEMVMRRAVVVMMVMEVVRVMMVVMEQIKKSEIKLRVRSGYPKKIIS